MKFQSSIFFFFNDTATTEIYTLSLHDALPISPRLSFRGPDQLLEPAVVLNIAPPPVGGPHQSTAIDRKSTRLNSSHVRISYAVFCLKKKKRQYATLYYRTR